MPTQLTNASTETLEHESLPATTPPAPTAPESETRWWQLRHPVTVSILVWAALLPLAIFGPSRLQMDPFSTQAMATVVALVLLGVVILAGWASVRPNAPVAGVAAGVASAGVLFVCRMALAGTPLGFGGMTGDMVRMSGLVTRYSETTAPVDAWVKDVGSEYPLLYPWLIGRVADLIDVPAWQLLGKAEALTMSLTVLASFALWRRWVPGWVALAIPLAGITLFGDPRKAFEVLALAVFLPWAIDLFGNPARRMHWAASGVIAGLLYLLYPGWMIYGSPGLVVLAFLTWRSASPRNRYLFHLAKVVAVAVVVSAWQLVPYVNGLLFAESEVVSDLFISSDLFADLFPFLEFTPLGLVQLVGLVGALALINRTFWARPLALIAAGAFAYRLVMTLRYAFTGHTMFLHYTPRLYGVALCTAGILTIAHVTGMLPALLARADVTLSVPRRVGVLMLAVVTAWVGIGLTNQWMPASGSRHAAEARLEPLPPGRYSRYAAEAHLEPLPPGRYSRYAPATGRRGYFPVDRIERAVRAAWQGPEVPVVLSSDERLFGYLPWYGYAGTDRTATSSLVRWDSRFAELDRLAGTTDPGAFAQVARNTAFGAIDVFVLREVADGPTAGQLAWNDLRFNRAQFDPARWTVTDVGSRTVVAVRR